MRKWIKGHIIKDRCKNCAHCENCIVEKGWCRCACHRRKRA